MGKACYPNARALLITADGGGSNSSRSRLWKVELQKLADEMRLAIYVRHFPPGTSKWNKIEHRMFCHMSLLQNSPAQAAAPHHLLSGSNFCREESFLGRAAKLRAWFSSFGTNTLLHSSNAQQPERNGRGSLS